MQKLFRFVLIYFFYYLYIVDSAAEIPTDYFEECQENTLDKHLRLILYLPNQVEDEALYYKILYELNNFYGKSLKDALESHFAHVQILFKLYSSYLPKNAAPLQLKLNNVDRFFGGFKNSIAHNDFTLARNAHVSGLLPTIQQLAKQELFENVGGKHSWINLHVGFVDNVPAYRSHIDVSPHKAIAEADFFSLQHYQGKLIILSTEKFLTNWAQFLYEEKVRYSSVYPYDVDLVQTITTTVGKYTCKTRSTQYSLRHLVDTYNHLYPTLFFDESKFLRENGVTFVLDSWRNVYTDLERLYFLKWGEDRTYFYFFMTLFLSKMPNSSILFQTLTSLHGLSKLHVKKKIIEDGFKSLAEDLPRNTTNVKDPITKVLNKHIALAKPLKRIVPIFLNHGLEFPVLDNPKKLEEFTPDCPQNAYAKALHDNNAFVIYTGHSKNKPALDYMKNCSSILRHDAVYYDLSSVPNYVKYAFDLMRAVEVHLSSIESKYRGAIDYLTVDYMEFAQGASVDVLFLIPKSPRVLLAPQIFNVFLNTIPKTARTPIARSTSAQIFKDMQYKVSVYGESDYMYTGEDTLKDCSCQGRINLNENDRKELATELQFDFSKKKAEGSSAIPKLYCCLKDKNIVWTPKSCKMIVILADSPPITENKMHPVLTKSVVVPPVEEIDRLIVQNNMAVTIISDPKYIHLWKTFFQNVKYRYRVVVIPSTPNTLFTTDVTEAISKFMVFCNI